ncbi:MAG: hypothetical protein HY815_20840 [Candidatus Riflebacteria bacterium]|nr:hypothetical protein [Candidatus Riflebacteria bacterium]
MRPERALDGPSKELGRAALASRRPGRSPARPPLREEREINLAAIDIGAGSIKLRIAAEDGPSPATVAQDRIDVRLGRNDFTRGLLDRSAMGAVVEALRRFRAVLAQHHVARYRAIATVLRDATNGQELVDLVRKDVGLEVEIPSREHQARLLFLGLSPECCQDGTTALFDADGQNLHVGVGERRRPGYVTSLPFGMNRLSLMFSSHEALDAHMVTALQEAIRGALTPTLEAVRQRGPAALVGSGASVRTLGPLARPTASRRNSLTRIQGRALAARLTRLPASQKEALGLSPERAAFACVAAWLVVELMEGLGQEEMRLTEVSLRDGILAQLVGDRSSGTLFEPAP